MNRQTDIWIVKRNFHCSVTFKKCTEPLQEYTQIAERMRFASVYLAESHRDVISTLREVSELLPCSCGGRRMCAHSLKPSP